MKATGVGLCFVSRLCLGSSLLRMACEVLTASDLDPLRVGQYPPYGEGSVQAIVISGDLAYAAFGGAGLHILDVRNASAPRLARIFHKASARVGF